jgi:hypothetical protein
MQRCEQLYAGLVLLEFVGNHDTQRLSSKLTTPAHFELAQVSIQGTCKAHLGHIRGTFSASSSRVCYRGRHTVGGSSCVSDALLVAVSVLIMAAGDRFPPAARRVTAVRVMSPLTLSLFVCDNSTKTN